MENILEYNIKGAQLLACPEDRSLIFFVNVTGEIKENIRSKKSLTYVAKKIVVKGTLDEIYKSEQTKRQFIREFFKEYTDGRAKAFKFDLSKIKITNVEIIRGLGYGIKSV